MLAIFAASDVIVTLAAFSLAYWIRFRLWLAPKGIPNYREYINPYIFILIAMVWLLIFSFSGLYQPRRGKSKIDEFFLVLSSIILCIMILMGCAFLYRGFSYSRSIALIFFIIDLFFVISFRSVIRIILQKLRAHGFNIRRVLILGAGHIGIELAEKISSNPGLGFKLIGFLDDDPEKANKGINSSRILGNLDILNDLIDEHNVDQVYITLPITSQRRIKKVLKKLDNDRDLSIKIVPDVTEYIALKAGVEDLDGLPIINLSFVPLSVWNQVIKRIVDILLSSIGLIILSPLFLIISIIIRSTSSGPVFYRQKRMGLNSFPFLIYKFRTMYNDAEDDTGPVWATENDPRRTKFGAFLRKWSLDELPQLLNVFRGEMSIVGPRPERPAFVEEFCEKIPQYMLRYKVKSGMTGWAQVNGWRGNTSVSKRLEYDIYYIENWSLTFDLKILFFTMWKGLKQKNAY